VLGLDLDFDPVVVRADQGDDLVGHVDRLDRADHGNYAGVALDLDRTGFRGVNEQKRDSNNKRALERGHQQLHRTPPTLNIR
jgi:hypothetical protein